MDQNNQASAPQEYTTPTGVYDKRPDIEYPKTPGFTPKEYCPVGGVILAEDPIEYNTNRRTVKLKVRNTGDRPIQVGSHYHFFEVNRFLEFDRPKAFGYHLNIPATTAIRFEPGEEKGCGFCRQAACHRLRRPREWVRRSRGYPHILSQTYRGDTSHEGIWLQVRHRRG